MQNINTTVLARRVRISDSCTTHPYEAGWAHEGVIFVQTEGEHPPLTVHLEVSPDGIHWIARPGEVALAAGDALAELPVTNFGNWLRLRIEGAKADAPARVLVHAAMKG